jgi:hypothetical protein
VVRYRVKPSKAASAFGMAVGIVFVGIGLFVAIPIFGAFGVFWTLVAAAIAIFNAINVFSKSGIAEKEIVADTDSSLRAEPLPFDERLRRLEQLKNDGLISDEEYRHKRAELMGEQW